MLIRLLCLSDFLASPFFLPLGGDRGLYYVAAFDIFRGNFLPDVFSFLPLYPYLISGCFQIVGGPNLAAIAIFQAVLDGLTALLIAGLTRRKFGNLAGIFSGLGFAFCGLDAAYSLVTMPVSLGLFWTALAATCVDLWQYRWNHVRAIILGLILGIGGQILGAFWLMLIPFSLWIGLSTPVLAVNKRIQMMMLVIAFGTVCLLPTLIHNVTRARQWIPLTAHAGLNIYMGNNPASDGYGTALPGLRINAEEMTRDSVVLASQMSGKTLTPFEADHFWKRQAMEFWRRQPAQAFVLLIHKAQRLVSFRDFDDTGVSRLLPESVRGLRPAVVGFGLIWLLACAGYGLRPGNRPQAGLWIMAGCFALGILLTFVTARYRLPLAVLLLPAAGGTLANLPAVIQNTRRGFNWRWAAGIVGLGLSLVPHAIPDTALVDDVNRANHWQQHGDSEKAIIYASQAVLKQQNSPEPWFVLGNAYISQHNYMSALEAFQHVLKLQPDRADALFNASRAYECLGDLESARMLNEHIIELEPRHAKAWFALAILYRDTGKLQQAQDALAETAGIVGWNHPDIIAFSQ